MVRRSFTAVLEKNATFTANFETEPYEAAWAGEARWFVRVIEMKGAGLKVVPQVSPDGLFWCDEGTQPPAITAPGLYSFPLREFGHWLRLRAEINGQSVQVLIYLALKE